MSKLNIVYGNILNYLNDKDLVVNSANRYMSYGSGVCGAIYRNAGKGLSEYCHNNFKEYMKVNEIRFTPGFDLGVDILHICCPKHHESQEPLNDLLNSYNNIFIGAKENNYKNIVSVSLGTGVNGYKHNEVSKEIVNRLNELVKDYDIDFTLVLPNEEIYTLYNIK